MKRLRKGWDWKQAGVVLLTSLLTLLLIWLFPIGYVMWIAFAVAFLYLRYRESRRD